MTANALLLTALGLLAASPDRPKQYILGKDVSPGILRNWTVGCRPFDPPDPSRPTLVFVQGFNPAPRLVRCTIPEQLALAVARRGGPVVNVMAWEWNAATWAGLRPEVNQANAVDHGRRLAAALQGAGLAAHKIHLVGQSTGCIVVTAAARALRDQSGTLVGQLTLLDPATLYHHVVFEQLNAGTTSYRVENYWADGPSGFGKSVAYYGVTNMQVDGPKSLIGVVVLPRSSHWHVASWYLDTIEDRGCQAGYNTSLPCVVWGG